MCTAKARPGRSGRGILTCRRTCARSGSRCSSAAAWARNHGCWWGTPESEARAFSSAVHGAGRAMSHHQAVRQWQGRELIDSLRAQGIVIRSHSARGVAEEAPGAYKDVGAVVAAAERAGLARRVARLKPLISIKG